MQRKFRLPLLALWFGLVALACNLGGEATPVPQLLPRETAPPPPQATFGYVTPAGQSAGGFGGPAVPVAGSLPADIDMANLLNQVDGDRLMIHVDALVGVGSRHVNSPQDREDFGIGAARTYIRSQFDAISQQSGGRLYVFEQPFDLTVEGVISQQWNVVGVLQGTEVGAGTILLGAHYDSISQSYARSLEYTPGANDNGSGVAALLEIARILSLHPPRATVMFVAFSAEEVGRQGSRALVNNYLRPFDPSGIGVNAMINVDTIGSQTRTDGSINDWQMRLFSAGPNDSPSRQMARNLTFIAQQYTPNMQLIVNDSLDREGRYGDHQSFSDAGIAAVRVMEAEDDQRRQNNDRDTIDDIQPAYLVRTTRSVLAITHVLANGLRPPSADYISLRDNGDGTRTLIWEPVPGATGYVVALLPPNALMYQSQVIEVTQNSVDWDGFVPERYTAVAIAARDGSGLIGPFSAEFQIR